MESILLIEDNVADVRLFQEYLKDVIVEPFKLTSTDSLEEARSIDQIIEPEVVIVDLSLPDTTGEETMTRATQYFRHKPIVILTGLDNLELAKQSVQQGVQDYLVKGEISGTSLLRSIQYAIERHRMQQAEKDIALALQKHNNQLAQTNERLESFTHMLSHDIRGPLNSILGLVNLSELEEGDPTMSSDLMGRIKTTAAGLDGHLNDILSLLQSQNSWATQASVQRWSDLLEQVVQLLDQKIEASQASVSYCLEATEITYPPSVLKSILLNLLSNAIKYRSDERPLRISIETRQVKEGVFSLIVRDNGRGMDLKKYGHKLFTPFKRFHTDTEGKGVGLYMIRKIVEELGGQVQVESEVDKGTAFTFLLSDMAPATSLVA